MTITCNPDALLCAIIKHVAPSRHIYDRETCRPGRIASIAASSEDTWKITQFLCAVTNGSHTCTVYPIVALNRNEPDDDSMNVAETDEIKTSCTDALS